MRVAVLGAGGTIAPAIVRDLADSEEVETLTLLDLDGAQARRVAAEHGGGKATAGAVDASDRQALTLALDGCGLLLNAASYRVNLAAMDAALAAACHYVDLGGLYHVTERQLALSDAFASAGLLAVLGAGAGPGKTNVMAVHAAAWLDEVVSVRCASAGLDRNPPQRLSLPYALATLIDEVTMPPQIYRDGRPEEIGPLCDGGTITFPEPIGRRPTIWTLHSEVLTLPLTLGASDCDFRLALGPGLLEQLTELARRPREELAAVRPAPPSSETWSAQHVELGGSVAGRPTTVTVTAVTGPRAIWGLGGGIVSTGSVAAATVRLLARGKLPYAGALPPERCLRPDELFGELETRGTTFETEITTEAPGPVPPGSPSAAPGEPPQEPSPVDPLGDLWERL